MNVNNLIEALEKWDGDMPVVVQSALKKEEAFPLQSVEWADRVESCLPRERLEIQIEVTGPQSRRFEVLAVGDKFAAVLDRLQRRFVVEPD